LKAYNADIPVDGGGSYDLYSDPVFQREMQLWYFQLIGVPLLGSFLLSLSVYLVFSKCMVREYVRKPTSGKIIAKWRCKYSQ
jgi:hypothetical protein